MIAGMGNAEVARALDEIASLLELAADPNFFRIRAYRHAAHVVADLEQELGALVALGADLTELPGIGRDLAAKLRALSESGTCDTLESLRAATSPAMLELLRVSGLGPKRVRLIVTELGLHTVEEVLLAARTGQIRALEGLGPKTEERILRTLERRLAARASATEREPAPAPEGDPAAPTASERSTE